MDLSELDTDINNYNLQDILDIIDLDETSSYDQRIEAMDELIDSMKQQNKGDLETFLIQARSVIQENEDSEDSDEEEDESDEDSGEEVVEDSGEEEEDEEDVEDVEDVEEDNVSENVLVGKSRYEIPAPDWYLNQGAVRTITQDMSVDTRFRPNYYTTLSTNFTIDLPEIQRKVISMRISAIEMPMTYYSISESNGNNKMLIISDSSFNSMDSNYTNVNDLSLSNPNIAYSDLQGNSLENFEPVQCAWVSQVIDGNYDTTSWMVQTSRYKAETAINEALSLATPGAIDRNGNFAKFTKPTQYDYLNSNFVETGAGSTDIARQDLRYSIHRINGKSTFSSPLPDENLAGTSYNYITNETNRKRISKLRFNIDSNGNLDTNTNIQTRLGWMLGFRAAEYVMGENIQTSTPVAAISEGTGFITGPRYAFLSMEDYINNSRPSFIVAYGTHTKANNIITRINLAGGGYHNLSTRDAGLTGHANRTREYFGPVDIQRLTIKLQDEFGRIIDINNMDWSFTVTFKKLYN